MKILRNASDRDLKKASNTAYLILSMKAKSLADMLESREREIAQLKYAFLKNICILKYPAVREWQSGVPL